jgi:uncharacterized protein YciI
MAYFVLTREPGPSWDRSRPMREQDDWDAHARFMDALVDDGFVLLGGPVGDGMRFLHIVDAQSEREVKDRLAEDPWTATERLRTASIEPWELLLDGRAHAREGH